MTSGHKASLVALLALVATLSVVNTGSTVNDAAAVAEADLFPFVVNPWEVAPDITTNVSHWFSC